MRAIDVHVHLSTAEGRRKWGFYGDALEAYFKFKMGIQTEEEMAQVYRDLDAMAVHKANIFVDLSGWSPKYFPPQLVREVNSRLQDKALFGTDFPFVKPDRWLRDFEQLELKPGVREKVMLENAKRALKLA